MLFREEEIIMPDEHIGEVKENYQWKVRGVQTTEVWCNMFI